MKFASLSDRRVDESRIAFVVLSISLSVLLTSGAYAQSGSRYPTTVPPTRSYQPSPGSSTRSIPGSSTQGSATQGTPVALSGFCPVCIIDMKKWVRGSAQYQASYDGKVYNFPSADVKQTFLKNPGKYVPALGGDCTVCLAKIGKRMPGSVFHSAYHQGRLYLFPGEDQKKMFVDNPAQFANVDLAMNGLCAVCKVEMEQDVPGDPKFAAYHKGMRYLFPGEDQLNMFHANPSKYAAPMMAAPGSPTSSLPTKDQTITVAKMGDVVTITGTSTCAGCEHGVTPIGSPGTLGLGVEAKDGSLVVVEEAHKSHPEIYDARFRKLSLEVHGTIIKHEDNVRWLQPKELRVLN